jgi:hypothetical protein
MLAKATGMSLRSVQRILAPHPCPDIQIVEGPGVCRDAQGHSSVLFENLTALS